MGGSGAQVRLSRNSQEIATATTDAAGQFSFGQLRSGQYNTEINVESVGSFVASSATGFDVELTDGETRDRIDFGVEEGPDLISILAPLFGQQLINDVAPVAFFAAIENLNSVETIGRWTFIDTSSRRLAFYTETTESSNGTVYAPLVSLPRGGLPGGGLLGGGLIGGGLIGGGGESESSESNVRLIGSMPLGVPDVVAVPFAEMALRGRPEEDLGNPLTDLPGVDFADLNFQYAPSPSESLEDYVLEAASVLALGASDGGRRLALLNAFREGNAGRNQLSFTWFFFADSDYQDIEEWQDSSIQTFLGEVDTGRDVPVAINVRIDRSEVLRLGNVWAANELFKQLEAASTDTLFRDDFLSQFETTSEEFATAFLGIQNSQFENVGVQLRDAAQTVGTTGEILVSLNPAGDIAVTAKEFYNADSVGERFFIASVAILPGSTGVARQGLGLLGDVAGKRRTYIVNGVERTYGQHFDGFSYGTYLKGLKGAAPDGMIDPHAHHILFKKGLGAGQQELVEEGQDILRRVGIDPIYGVENLTWAPNIEGQHVTANLREVVDRLRDLDSVGAGYEDFVEALQELGDIAAQRTR